MKKIVLFIMTLIVVFAMTTFTACGTSNKANDSAKKSNTDGSKAPNTTVSKNGETVNIGQSLKWPKDAMGKLPEPKGKITAVLKDKNEGQCTVAYAEMSPEDAKNYANKIKELGYTEEVELSDIESIIIGGTAADGSQVYFAYKTNTKDGTISYKTSNN